MKINKLTTIVCVWFFATCILVFYLGCSNPYVNPQTSKAISEARQIELLKEQNKLLERIAVAIENKNK